VEDKDDKDDKMKKKLDPKKKKLVMGARKGVADKLKQMMMARSK